jgi:PKD repeat protein
MTAGIELLDPITRCDIQPIRAIVSGKPLTLKWHCAFGSNVTFSVNFDDGHIAEFRPISDNFIGNNLSYNYTSAGHYLVKIVVSSPLGINVSLTERVLVERPVKGLQVRLLNVDNTEVLHIATLSEISIERVLVRGSHVKCTFNFGDVQFTSDDAIVNHTYRKPGNYHVNITCYNHVSSLWTVLNTSLIVENISPLKNLSINIRPTIFGQASKFQLLILQGNLFTCEWDLGDNTSYITSYPQVNATIPHRYRKVGTYNASVTCRNMVGEETITTLAEVDEPIRNVSLTNPSSFVRVNQSVAFILTLSKGSRVKYCLDCRDRYLYLRDNVTRAKITHAYTTAGEYSVIAHLWNSVSSTTIAAVRPITVEFPVKGIELFTALPKRCSSLDVAVCLNLTENTPAPSNASVLISYGDNSAEIFAITELKSQKCFRKHEYGVPGVYNVTANVSNHVSSQNFLVKVRIQIGNVEVRITGGGSKDRPTIVRESEILLLVAHVSHSCHVAKMMIVHWSIFEWNFGSVGKLVASDDDEIMISKNSSEFLTNELELVGSNFGTGFYVVRVTVGFMGTDGDLRNITGSNYTWFEMYRPPLIARIKGKLCSCFLFLFV